MFDFAVLFSCIKIMLRVKGTHLRRLNVWCDWSRLNEHDPRKCLVTEHAIDFIRWCFAYLFLDTISNSCFTSWVPRCARCLRVILTSPKCLWRHGYNTRSSQFCLQITEMPVNCSHFCHRRIVFVSVEWTFNDILQHSRKQVSPREKVWSTGF